MCDPITAGAAVAAAAGGYMQQDGANAAANADAAAQARNTQTRTQIRNTELTRQNAFRDQAGQQFATALANNGASGQAANMDKAVADRQNAYAAEESRPASTASPLPGASDAPKIISDQVGAKLSDALTRAGQSNAAKANLEGFGDQQTQLTADNAITGGNIGLIQNQARGSASVVPSELDAAQQQLLADQIAAKRKGSGERGLGSLLSTAGSLASLYGVANPGALGSFSSLFGPARAGANVGGAAFVPVG